MLSHGVNMLDIINIGGVEYTLKYTSKSVIAMEKTGGREVLGTDGVFPIGHLMSAGLQTIVGVVWFLRHALLHEYPKMSMTEAAELFDTYVSERSDDGDDGTRYKDLLDVIGDAMLRSRGIDRKKLALPEGTTK